MKRSTSVHGTVRTSRDVQLGSAMRTKADLRQPYGFMSSRPNITVAFFAGF
jgi:hypothetical protein